MQRQNSEGRPVEDVPQCWKDLEAETGFKCYIDYVRAYKDSERQSLYNLLFDLEQDLDERITRCCRRDSCPRTCLMLELLKGADLAIELRRRWFGGLGTEILEALREPPRDVCVQVFIWDISDFEFVSPRLVDAFGLGLEISPQFFKALYLLLKGQPVKEDLIGHETELRPLRSDFVVMGNAVITISRYLPTGRDSIPVVLIAGNLTPDRRMESVLDCVDQEFRKAPALQLPAALPLPASKGLKCSEPGTSTTCVIRYMPSHRYTARYKAGARLTGRVWYEFRDDSWVLSYSELLNELLRRDDLRGMSGNTLSFVALLPVMQLDVLLIRQSCRLLRLILSNAGSNDADFDIARIHPDRWSLRRLVEDVEDSLNHLETHVTCRNNEEWLKQPVYKSIEQQVRQCCLQARRLEAEARDSLQIEAGLLALQESRKSIELSNYQIREGKRVTILAFVYVPLNLATSIFGMNLQQLNNNGQHVWVFIFTAITAVLVTAGSWFCFEQISVYGAWQGHGQRRRPRVKKYSLGDLTDRDESGTKYDIATRMAMLVWLMRNGHKSWMQKSGAWRRILVNNMTGLQSNVMLHKNFVFQHQRHSTWGMTAGEYVTEFSAATDPGFDPFDPKIVSWGKSSYKPPT